MGLEIGKEEIKVSFYGNDMNLYKKGPKNDTSK